MILLEALSRIVAMGTTLDRCPLTTATVATRGMDRDQRTVEKRALLGNSSPTTTLVQFLLRAGMETAGNLLATTLDTAAVASLLSRTNLLDLLLLFKVD